jgi:glucose/arabinose dehydrogenase
LRVTLGVLALAPIAIIVASCSSNPASPAPPAASAEPTAQPSPAVCAAGPIVAGVPALRAQVVASGLEHPLDLQAPRADHQRVFVVEQAGRVRVVKNGELAATPFLDISDRIRSGGERGLLGLAFHPRYATNRRFFVNYTDVHGDTRISEFRSTSDDAADPASERIVLAAAQPFANHNGGGLAFGPDGLLYIGLGDGGSSGDPFGNAQNLATPLGKILRIDVDQGSPYGVPPDNPFASIPGAFPAIWAYGLRNPFRIAFDAATGDLWIGDVGQNRQEEIDVDLVGHRGGENYGWNIVEGSLCFNPMSGCNTAGLVAPVLEYSHAEGCAVTGGVVYRGCRMPGLGGAYFYGDYCSAFVRSLRLDGGQAVDQRDWTASLGVTLSAVSSFGTDADGEIYVVDYSGKVLKLVPGT